MTTNVEVKILSTMSSAIEYVHPDDVYDHFDERQTADMTMAMGPGYPFDPLYAFISRATGH